MRDDAVEELADSRAERRSASRRDRANGPLVIIALLVLIAVLVVGVFLVRELTSPRVPATLAEQQIAELEAQLDEDPGNALLYFKLADAYYSVDEYEDALGVLDDLRSQETTGYTLAQVMYGTGRIEAARGNAEAAVQQYRDALETWELPEAHYALAELYMTQGDLDKAISRYEAYLELQPADAGAWVKLAGLYEDTGDKDEALAAYQRAATMLPDDATIAAEVTRLEGQQ